MFLQQGQIMVCPITLRRKKNTGMWTRILMSFNSFNDSYEDSLCTESHTNRKKSCEFRAGIKYLT